MTPEPSVYRPVLYKLPKFNRYSSYSSKDYFSNYIDYLFSLIDSHASLFRMSESDFTRIRKLPLARLITILLTDTRKAMSTEIDQHMEAARFWGAVGSGNCEDLKSFMDNLKNMSLERSLHPGDKEYDEDYYSLSKAALSKARNKLNPDGMLWMNYASEAHFYACNAEALKTAPFLEGYIQIGIDGSDFRCPDTPELRKLLGTAGNDPSNPSNPVMGKSSWACDLQNHRLLDCQLNRYKYSERQMALDHLDVFNNYYGFKAIFEFDRGYFSYDLMHLLYANPQYHFIFRLASNHLKDYQKQVGVGEEKTFKIHLSRADTNQHRKNKSLRNHMLNTTYYLRIAKPVIGEDEDGNPKHIVIVTDIPEGEVSLEQLAEAYWDRWNSETIYDYLKNDLLMEEFCGTTWQKIRQEIYAAWTVFNMTSAAIMEVKEKLPIEQEKYRYEMDINYSAAFGTCKRLLLSMLCTEDMEIRQGLQVKLMKIIREKLTPYRPGRSYRRDGHSTKKPGPRTKRHI